MWRCLATASDNSDFRDLLILFLDVRDDRAPAIQDTRYLAMFSPIPL
jgi:hypothetical protein